MLQLSAREKILIEGMIETQINHAERCGRIADKEIAKKQRRLDLSRAALLNKILKIAR